MVDHRPESLDDDLPHHDDHDEDDDDDVSCSAAGPVITVAVEPMFGLVSAPPSPQPPLSLVHFCKTHNNWDHQHKDNILDKLP